jgi:hypothetical protein
LYARFSPREAWVSDIFREIEEDLHRDRYKKLWAKYGNVVIAAAVVLVVATGAWEAWKTYKLHRDEALGQRYAEALKLAQAGHATEAAAAFAKLAEEASAGYTALARLQEAALLAKAGNAEGAVAVYDRLAADSSVDQAYRDLATLLAVLHGIDKGDPAVLASRLEPLTAAASPWRHSALELSAILAERMGDKARAEQLYARLADDGTAPADIRARAAEMLAALKG